MPKPLISILIPCHNAAPWLAEALTSAVTQTWPFVETIVVDDGSTDRSLRIARNFGSGQCRVLRQEQRGASAARNRAFEEAQGEFIQYLDADDLLAPDKLEQQMKVICRLELDCLSFGSVVHFSDGDTAREGKGRLPRAPIEGSDPCDFLTDLWTGNALTDMVQTSQWLTPRALIRQAGTWDESLTLDDDGEFFSRVVLAAKRIVPAPDARCYYRKFRSGQNLSAVGSRESAMKAAQLKCTRLLAKSGSRRARDAVRHQVSREIVEAYPAFPTAVADGMKFLQEHQLQISGRLPGSPWFLRLYPFIGWQTTRWLQWQYRCWRKARFSERLAGSLPSLPSPEAENCHPGARPAVGRCSPPHATDHPHA